ncbi:actin-like ATPase domain-containing protein [Violaceomyces palustris]|uniref:Actin-like ATPase domain-containing protein n=1 Tax=Violaceomyces palustris TaxID=1673888 RepID=A0ACD0NY72_9BASI|nr:actin-like ATPase domain-containing protein [Violaceomyces palustris]
MAPVAEEAGQPSTANGSTSKFYQPPIHQASEPPKPKTVKGLGYHSSPYWNSSCPLVIDNGSSELRAGFAIASTDIINGPYLYYDNLVSKTRDRKRNASVLLVGNDVYADSLSRGSIRSPFDGDVICGWDAMENILDYTFSKLGIDTSTVQHPIMMTETLCNPAYSRGVMNELMFEGYGVPSVNYGLDCIFSAYQNGIDGDALIVSSGRSSTFVVPTVGGKGILTSAKRLSWGGSQASDFLLRLIQLKYPNFPTRVSQQQAQNMLEELCYVSEDYAADIKGMEMAPSLTRTEGTNHLTAMEKADVIVQFPYTEIVRDEKTEEELKAQAERRKAAGLRLQEQTRRIRLEKLMQKENDLKYYAQLKEWKAKERKSEYLKRLESEGFDSEQELENQIKKIEAALKRSRAREAGEDEEEDKEPPSFPLIDVPDVDLDEEGIKEKRRQRLMKAGYDARIRAKAEKAEEKRLRDEEIKKDEDERINDPQAWSRRMRKEYDEAINRIKERKRLKEMLSDRKSLAAQQRMKNITALASDGPSASGTASPQAGVRKRKRGGDEDTFGANDDDWAIYREIHNADDSEEEEDSYAQLAAFEERLLQNDPTFTQEDTYSAQQARKNRLTLTFFNGPGGGSEATEALLGQNAKGRKKGDEPSIAEETKAENESIRLAHQVHLNVERIRVPEVLWQPSIAGVDQAGIDEICSHVLNGFDLETRLRMSKNVFYTGRHTSYRNFGKRLESSLRTISPWQTPLIVRGARDPRFDAWRGMAKWCLESNPAEARLGGGGETFRSSSITRQDFLEKGQDWFYEHAFSGNWRA